jgi:ribose transport system permease protein
LNRFRERGVLIALALLCGAWALTLPNFLGAENLYNVSRDFSFVGIMAIGEAFVMIAGGIDLSVGSVMGLSGVVAAGALASGASVFFAIVCGLGTGLLCGMANGGLIAWAKMPPFIATLGMMSVARSLAFERTQAQLFSGFPDAFQRWGQGDLLRWGSAGLSFPTAILLALVALATLLLRRTRFGRYVYAIGGNEASSRLSGIPSNAVKAATYALAGLLAAAAGILQAAYLNAAQGQDGQGYELDVIAAVVIGGVSLTGGEGSAFGAALGAALMGVLRNGLVLRGEPAFRQILLIGVVIWLAAGADWIRRRKKARA